MTLTDRELKHLKTVIDYLYNDERKDYENEGQDKDHIFVSVLGLQEILWRGSPCTVGQPTPEAPSNMPDLHLVTD